MDKGLEAYCNEFCKDNSREPTKMECLVWQTRRYLKDPSSPNPFAYPRMSDRTDDIIY